MHISLRSFFFILLALTTLAACTAAPSPTLTPQPTATPLPTVEPTATETATLVPPTATETATNTPAPTETNTPVPTESAAERARNFCEENREAIAKYFGVEFLGEFIKYDSYNNDGSYNFLLVFGNCSGMPAPHACMQ